MEEELEQLLNENPCQTQHELAKKLDVTSVFLFFFL